MNIAQQVLDDILPTVAKPARYTGHEWNSVVKDWDQVEVKVALAYPDIYEVGMSNLGLMILYDILNKEEGVLAERVYAPWIDMEEAMRRAGVPLYSLESRRPLAEFDIIGFSLQYELNYTNVLNMLDLAGLSPLAAERSDVDPLIIGGGSCTYNAEPLADFFDLFVVGEGEEVLLELVSMYRRSRITHHASRITHHCSLFTVHRSLFTVHCSLACSSPSFSSHSSSFRSSSRTCKCSARWDSSAR